MIGEALQGRIKCSEASTDIQDEIPLALFPKYSYSGSQPDEIPAMLPGALGMLGKDSIPTKSILRILVVWKSSSLRWSYLVDMRSYHLRYIESTWLRTM